MDDLFFHPGDQVPPVIGPKEPDPPLLSPPKKAFPSSAKKGFFLGISLLLLLAAGVLGVTAVQKGGIFNIFKRATQDEDDPSCSINLQQPTFRPGEESTFSVTFNSPDEPIRWPCSGGTTFGDCNCDSFAVLCFSHSSTKGTTQEVSNQEVSNNCSGDIHDCTVNFKFTASDSLGSGQINIAVKNTDGSGSCSHLIDIVAPTVTPTSVIPTLTPTAVLSPTLPVIPSLTPIATTTPTATPTIPMECGNQVCDQGETCLNCEIDCGGVCPAIPACTNLTAEKDGGGILTDLKMGDRVKFKVTFSGTVDQVAVRVLINGVEDKVFKGDNATGSWTTLDYQVAKYGSYEIQAFVKSGGTWR